MAYQKQFRAKAVAMVIKDGPSYTANKLGVSRSALHKWVKEWFPGGVIPTTLSTEDMLAIVLSDQDETKQPHELEAEIQELRRVNRILLDTIDALTSQQNTSNKAG